MRAFLKKAGRQFCYQVNSTKINKFKTSALADIQHRLLTTNNDIKTATKEFVTKSKKTEHLTRLDTYEKIPNLLLKATIFMCAITCVNVAVYSTTTFLHLCISWGLTPITKLIIKSGADPDIVIADVAPALHFAILQQNIEIVNALIAAGADLNAKDKDGFTPLKLASNKGYTEIVNLIDKVANPIDTSSPPEPSYYLEGIKYIQKNEPIEQAKPVDDSPIDLGKQTECLGADICT